MEQPASSVLPTPRISTRLSSNTAASAVSSTTPSRNVARRGGLRSRVVFSGKRRRVYLGEDAESPSVGSSSTGVPEDVNFGEDGENNDDDDSDPEDDDVEDDDDDDDDWTPEKMNISSTSSRRKGANASNASSQSRRKSPTGGNGGPPFDGFNSLTGTRRF